ncbi:MAG: pilus assembly protein PilM [Lachnospiraceae bacterium]|nr:pilus assembly protein PilM [Lachnospiraceae bacterium]
MANSVVSVDIGSTTTRIVEIDYKRNNPNVYKCFSIPTPEGAIDDGQILDPEGFGELLKQSLTENGVKTKKAVYSITSSKIANREVIVPKVKERSLAPLVNAKATEYFPVDMSLYHLAYNQMGEVEEDGRKQLKMLVLAAPKDLLESYYDLSKAAGLSIEALDYAGNSIMPVIRADVGEDVTLVIKIDEASSVLTVLDSKKITLQRNITYGSDSVVEEVVAADTLGGTSYDDALKLLRLQKLIDLSVEEPVEKKRGPGRRKKIEETAEESESGVSTEMDLRRQRLIFNVTQSLDMFVGSVTRVIDYYNSRNTERPITKCLLTGMGADFVGLDQMLASEIETEVRVLDTVSCAKLAKDVKKISIGEYIACIGASIDPMDLIPPEHDKRKAGRAKAAAKEGKSAKGGLAVGSDQMAVIGWVLLGVGVVATGALLALSLLPYNQAKSKNTALTTELNSLMPIVDVYNQYMDKQALYNEISTIYNMTNTRNDGLRNFVDEMEAKLPSQSRITAFTSDGLTVNLSFECSSKEEAVNIVNNLRSFDSLAMISVSQYSDTINEEDMTSKVVFSVTGTYKLPDAVSINQLGTTNFETYDSFTVDVTDTAADTETAETTEEGEGEEQ